jgi:hypothetical protein
MTFGINAKVDIACCLTVLSYVKLLLPTFDFHDNRKSIEQQNSYHLLKEGSPTWNDLLKLQ